MGLIVLLRLKQMFRLVLGVIATVLLSLHAVLGFAQGVDDPAPLIEQDAAIKVSDHVHVILDDSRWSVPNVGIIIGDKATLVIDTGLGLKNGEIVLEEVRKLSDNKRLYIASTHIHAEHDSGAGAFPQDAMMIRTTNQQQDIDEFGMDHAGRIARRSKALEDILEGAFQRPADILCDNKCSIDLGGITVSIQAAGTAHTSGDTIFYVEEEKVLFTGDVVMRRYPRLASPISGPKLWLKALETVQSYDIDVLVPSHGRLGDTSTIDTFKEYFLTIQSRVAELLNEGVEHDEIVKQITKDIAPVVSDWNENGGRFIRSAVRRAINEAAPTDTET